MLENTCTEQPLLSHPDPLNQVTAWPGIRRNQGYEPPELSSVTHFLGPSGAGPPHALILLSVFLHLTLLYGHFHPSSLPGGQSAASTVLTSCARTS